MLIRLLRTLVGCQHTAAALPTVPEPQSRAVPVLRDEFASLLFGSHALQKILDEYEFQTVLDIGCGSGEHARILESHGKKVTAIDYGASTYFSANADKTTVLVGDFNSMPFVREFDCVWCSHVLEHQENAATFLVRINEVLSEGGVLAITVPPLKHQIVGGHVSLWNAGMVLYRLVLAGFDCSDARVLQYGYNISVIVRKRKAQLPDDLSHDRGDLRRLRHLLPATLAFTPDEYDDPFDGDIRQLNW